MSDVSGIPNLGIPGMGGGGFFADKMQPSAPAMSADQINAGMWGRASPQQGQAVLNNLYGPLGFGGATAQAAATGAAYGRAVGPLRSGSVFNTGTAPVPYLGTGGGDPMGGGGFGGRGSIPSMPAQSPVPYLGTGGGDPYGGGGFGGGLRDQIASRMMPPAPSFNDTFSQLGMHGNQMQNQPAIDAVQQFSGRGTGGFMVPKSTPPTPEELGTGWTPDFNGIPSGGAGSPGSFADRFAFRNAGTPSEYTTSPYQDVGGTTHQPNIPPGYQTPFSADNPSGALTRQMRAGGGAPPVMNSSSGEDTLTAQDANIPFGPRGSFDPSAFNPSQYQPSSPFGSGGGVGGLRGGSGGLGTGTGTQMPPTQLPFFGGGGSGFGAPGSTQSGGLYAGRGNYPALIGASNDAYGNPFIQGNAQPHARGATPMGGGIGLGGLDALGQGTVFRGLR